MKANIVIFGKNSIIAQNFIDKSNFEKYKLIYITRKREKADDIICDISELITPQEIRSITNAISKQILFEETIFILFSWCGGPRIIKKKQDIWSINMSILQNFINISESVCPKKIIFLSSAGSLYKENISSYNFNESDYPSPKTLYGKQKFLAEQFITYYSNSKNIDLAILRISSAYGFDKRFSDQGVINKWLFCAIKNKKLKLYNSPKSLINFISFDQISNALITSIDKQLSGIYNIGTTKSISLEDIIKEIIFITKKNIEVEAVNHDLRLFNIDTSKFHKKTGIKYHLKLKEDIKKIYKSIFSEIYD